MLEIDDFAFFDSHLSDLGYSGFHVPKPTSPCLRMKGNIGPDGNAIFVRKDRFVAEERGYRVLEMEDGTQSNATVAWCVLKDVITKKR